MRRWRLPLALSAILVLAQLLHTAPLADVVSGSAPSQVRLSYPAFHVVFAPLTLLADYLNGGSVADLKGFGVWTLLVYLLLRLALPGRPLARLPSRAAREAGAGLWLLVAAGLFLWWGARWSRPIPRLVASDSALVIFDIHSHTSASHDGRSRFGAAANASWHLRAGFDVAFVTDHNVFGAARQWQRDRAGRPPRLLDGEELSLAGLHLVVLGNSAPLDNMPWNATFDSTLALIAQLARDTLHGARGQPPYLVASLPEYWRNHWGADLGRLVSAGVQGMEIWTTSPRAMSFPSALRSQVIARGRVDAIGLFGATDMHGLGYAATVWNVTRLEGWRALTDSALTGALLARFRERPGNAVQVVALRRAQPEGAAGRAFAFPLGLWTVLRGASPAHALAVGGWVWVVALLRSRRRTPPAP